MELRKAIRIFYRNTRRQFEKHIGGYASEYTYYARKLISNQNPPETRFVLYAYQRTGSTLLVDLLNSHPMIDCQGELLLNRMHNPSRYLVARSVMARLPTFGFKLLTPHFSYQNIHDPQAFMTQLHESGYQIILLQRTNVFQTALSLLYAMKSWRFHFRKSHAQIELEKIWINPEELISKIEWIEHSKKIQEESVMHLPHLRLIYEEVLLVNQRHQETIDNICDYLGLSHSPVNSEFIKLTPDSIYELVTNADEVIKHISQTKYRKYIEEI